MRFSKTLFRYGSTPPVLIGLTLACGALFKVSAFAREAFIAAKFGLSAVTDAYFGLQQFPITLGAFVFGAFALAFTPAYAEARRRSGQVAWLPGLLFYGCLIGLALMVLMLACSPFLLHAIHSTGTNDVRRTLAILSFCYLPIVCIGIWTGICTARGHYLWATSISGSPYLVMTLVLFGLYAAGRLNNLSLPISMAAGFGLVGLYSFVCTVSSNPFPARIASLVAIWRFPDFRKFLRQLAASSCENSGSAGNQLLMLYFLSQEGTGVVSANTCAMRIGLLGYSMVSQPLAQMVQARLCSEEDEDREALFRRWILIVGCSVLVMSLALLGLRFPIIRIVYMHGKFKGAEVNQVASILPAWIGYFVVMSMNGIVARFLFVRSQGAIYVRRQLWAYVAANLLRLAIVGSVSASWIIWCSVLTEGSALALNIRTCIADVSRREIVPVLTTSEEL